MNKASAFCLIYQKLILFKRTIILMDHLVLLSLVNPVKFVLKQLYSAPGKAHFVHLY